MMKTKYIFIGSIFLLLCCTYSCKKEIIGGVEPISVEEDCYCEPFPEPDISFGDPSLYIEYGENYMTFVETNPNNANEIVYIHGSGQNITLRFLNSVTKEKRILFNENIVGRISWSSKDWILFQRSSDLSIFKIKSSGDSLTQLTYGNTYHFGTWNYSGDRFMVYNQHKSTSRTEIMNEDGVVVDEVNFWDHDDGVWNHPHYYLGSHAREIILIDTDNKSIKKKIDFPSGSNINTLGWVSLNTFLYTNGNKLFSYDVDADQIKLLKCECNKSLYALSSSSDFSKITGIQVIATSLPDYITHINAKIVLVNSEGIELQEIIP